MKKKLKDYTQHFWPKSSFLYRLKAMCYILFNRHFCIAVIDNIKSKEPKFRIMWQNFDDQKVLEFVRIATLEVEFRRNLSKEIDELTK